MQIRVLFDKDAERRNLYTGLGLSLLIGDKILFDTGANGPHLLANMETLGVTAADIETIVISHDHWDHTGGLWDILSARKGLKVYACPHFSTGFKKRVRALGAGLIENTRPSEIAEGVFVTGQITGRYKDIQIPEQALILKSDKGISVITGCAHPGIVTMLEEVIKEFPGEEFYLVCGGFHLVGMPRRDIKIIINRFRDLGVKRAGPTHCTGEEAIRMFEDEYKKDLINVIVAQTIEA